MATYTACYSCVTCFYVEIEADNVEEAIEIAEGLSEDEIKDDYTRQATFPEFNCLLDEDGNEV